MSEIKYPNKIVKDRTVVFTKSTNQNKARLGADFEDMINDTNKYYLSRNIAAIYKKPTPVQVVKTEFPKRSMARITEAYYKTPSTTDYNGIYKGYYIDFEAKSCHSESFPFGKIFTHQVEHLRMVDTMGGIAFLLIEFPNKKEIFYLPAKLLLEEYDKMSEGGRKSIPYSYFVKNAYLIKRAYTPQVDYLKCVDLEIKKLKQN